MNHKRRSALIMLMAVYPNMFSLLIVENRVLDAVLIGISVTGGFCMMRMYIKGDPEENKRRLQAQEQQEIQRRQQNIAALEEELGYEPLNLHEIHDVVMETRPQGSNLRKDDNSTPTDGG